MQFDNVYNDLNTAITDNIEITGVAEIASDANSANVTQSVLAALTKAWQTGMNFIANLPDWQTYFTKNADGSYSPIQPPVTDNGKIEHLLTELSNNLTGGSPSASLSAVNLVMTVIAQGDDDNHRAQDMSLVQSYYSTANSQGQMEETTMDTVNKSEANQVSSVDTQNMSPFTDMSSTAIANGVEQGIAGFLQQTF